jgi:4'-phosphopantetheinyl transferase
MQDATPSPSNVRSVRISIARGALQADGVDVLCVRDVRVLFADVRRCSTEDALAVVSVDERERAAQFARESDRARALVARGLLRRFLGAELDTDPAGLRFGSGPYGKPFLQHAAAPPFNVSHSGAYVAIAVGASGAVGIDIEVVRTLPDAAAIARRFLPREFGEIESRADIARRPSFLRAWTCKEAVVKALGYGLSLPLDAFEVTFGTGPRVVAHDARVADAGLVVSYLDPVAGVVGALAVGEAGGCAA